MNGETRIRDVIKHLWIGGREPLLFKVFNTHKIVRNDEGTPNMRIGQGRLEYNEEWVMDTDEKVFNAILLREGMRAILKHPYEREQPNKMASFLSSEVTLQEYLFNQMEMKIDMPVAKEFFSHHLKSSMNSDMRKFKEVYEDVLTYGSLSDEEISEQFGKSKSELDNLYNDLPSLNDGELDRRHKEFYYELIQDDLSQMEPMLSAIAMAMGVGDGSGEGDAEAEGSGGGEGSESDDTEDKGTSKKSSKSGLEKNAELWQPDSFTADSIDNIVKEAMMGSDDSWGSVKGSFKERVIANLKPKADYKKILRQFKASIVGSSTTLTRMRQSRRFKGQMGTKVKPETMVNIYVDVSASMSTRTLQNAFAFCNRFFNHGVKKVSAYQWDAELSETSFDLTKPKFDIELCGRGGTDVTPVFKKCIADYKANKFSGAVIFTDGYFSEPNLTIQEQRIAKKMKRNIVWVYEEEKTMVKHKYEFHNKYGIETFIVPQ